MANVPILKVRAEALHANLKKINRQLHDLPNRRKDLSDLDDKIDLIRGSLKAVTEKVRTAKTNLEFAAAAPKQNSQPAFDVSDIADAESKAQGLLKELVELQAMVGNIRSKCFRVEDRPVGQAIAEDLTVRTSAPLTQLAALDKELLKGKHDTAGWNTFSATTKLISQHIFGDYVEFLGGLALRDTGFDEGICTLADGLLRTYAAGADTKDRMLTIPTRKHAVAMTLARIIRVAFPDWTIWALPSTAHEFWYVFAQSKVEGDFNVELQSATANPVDKAEPRFNECLADAFATYTMGPAYAYLAVYQLLDPAAPFEATADNAAGELRLAAILEMLECLDSTENAMAPPYAGVRAELRSAWDEAIAEVGAPPTDKERAKTETDRAQVEADRPRVKLLVRALWETLGRSPMLPFTTEIWNEADSWVPSLLNNEIKQIKIPNGAELRHVLNAGWRARVREGRPANVDLTSAVNSLAGHILGTTA